MSAPPPAPGDAPAPPADPLADVRRHRRQLDVARRALEFGCDSRSEHSQLSIHASGARRGLEAAVRAAGADEATDREALTAAAGLTGGELDALLRHRV